MDWLNRIVTGQSLTTSQLRWAALFVIFWFLMDFVQFIDWLIGKLS